MYRFKIKAVNIPPPPPPSSCSSCSCDQLCVRAFRKTLPFVSSVRNPLLSAACPAGRSREIVVYPASEWAPRRAARTRTSPAPSSRGYVNTRPSGYWTSDMRLRVSAAPPVRPSVTEARTTAACCQLHPSWTGTPQGMMDRLKLHCTGDVNEAPRSTQIHSEPLRSDAACSHVLSRWRRRWWWWWWLHVRPGFK